jgi:hypothetical protein
VKEGRKGYGLDSPVKPGNDGVKEGRTGYGLDSLVPGSWSRAGKPGNDGVKEGRRQELAVTMVNKKQ